MYQKFECKVKYEKVIETGAAKIVTENYLVEGVTFGDVEQTIHKELEPYISGEFMVDSIKRAKYSEVVTSPDGDYFFKSKVTFISINEESGAEKKSSTNILVQAAHLNEVTSILETYLSDTMSDYEISGVNKTPIIDQFVLPELKKEEAK